MKGNAVGRHLHGRAPALTALALLASLLLSGTPQRVSAEEASGSCVDCHSDPRLLVTNKKLYDYYREWDASVHHQEEVTCVDCHGGNPKASDKKAAHAKGVAASDKASGIYFKNIPSTCGACHDEILDGFQESSHATHVAAEKDEAQGPTCVTCHGSMDVAVLNVNSVEAACVRCHNEKSDNHPEIPEEARTILNRFLSINRFYRYISIRAEPAEAKAFFSDMDDRLEALSITWHTFDLCKIDAATKEVLGLLKAKRNEIRMRSSKPPR